MIGEAMGASGPCHRNAACALGSGGGVAVLFDADNVPAWQAQHVAAIAGREGSLVLFRAYGREDALKLSAWGSAVRDFGVRFVACPEGCVGKNSADILMTVDAMDMLAANACGTFIIASNDSDFLPLAKRLRSAGKRVVSVGTHGHAAACHGEFDACYILEGRFSNAATDSSAMETREDLIGLFSRCICEASGGVSCCSLSRFTHHLRKLQPGINSKTYGYPTLKKLVLATKAFEIYQVKGGEFVIREKDGR